jgi:hypothetical protein
MLSNDFGVKTLPWLRPTSNEQFVPCNGTAHFDLHHALRVLMSPAGVGVRTGKPQCANACGFFNGSVRTETTPARR